MESESAATAHVVGSAAVIARNEQTSDALRETQQHLISIYNSVADVIFYLAVESNGRFRVVSVNAAFLRVTGLAQEDVIGKTIDEVIPEPSLTIVLEKYRQAIEERTVVHWEETSDYPAGRLTGEVSVTPVFDSAGVCTHLVGSVHDITARTRVEQALRESEERFRIMADTAPVMIVTSDQKGRGTFFNKVWLDFTGRTIEQELGNGWIANLHPDDLEFSLKSLSAATAARRECRLEYRLRRADGEYRFVMCRGVPRFERNGIFAGYVGSLVDVTDLRRSQQALEEYQGQLQELSAGLLTAQETASRQLARELHDSFSQELVTVKMQISNLTEEVDRESKLGRQLCELGNKVGRLATDLHLTSRKLHTAVLDDLGLITALSDECESFQLHSGILTRFVADDLPPLFPKDVSLCLYRVTQECLRNIVKHATDANMVHVSLTVRPEEVVLSVANDGRGFDLKESRQKGGLGLISMEERVRLVSGSISIRSQPEEGTVVEVVVATKDRASEARA
jgi:PAS domain S-box-containing protein